MFEVYLMIIARATIKARKWRGEVECRCGISIGDFDDTFAKKTITIGPFPPIRLVRRMLKAMSSKSSPYANLQEA